MAKAKKDISYSEATQEISKIIDEIENNEIEIDLLSDKVKRVSFLLDFCKKKLKTTEEYMDKILNKE